MFASAILCISSFLFTDAPVLLAASRISLASLSSIVFSPLALENVVIQRRALDKLESECDIALEQIDERMYAKEYEDDYDNILCYGISFFKKRCLVKKK